MKVRDAMQRKVVTISVQDSLALATQLMLWNRIRHLPVMHDGHVVGIMGERDALKAQAKAGLKLATPVKQVMGAAEHIHPDADLGDAASDMSTRGLDCLAVVDAGQLVGILTSTDVLGTLAQCAIEPPAQVELVAKDLMTPDPVCVSPDDSLLESAAKMSQHGFRHLCVVDGEKRLVGMLSDRDLRSLIGNPMLAAQDRNPSARLSTFRVSHAMTEGPRIAVESTPMADLVNIFLLEHIGAVPVVNNEDRVCGIVSYIDVLRAMAAGVT